MFVKIFSQIFDSSVANDYQVRHTLMDLLALADPTGRVDMTMESIQARTRIPMDILVSSMSALSSPDPQSRSPEYDGRRIVLLDSHRNWGWQIVNYLTYRNMKDEDARRDQNRINQQRHRERARLAAAGVANPSASVSNGQQQSAQEEVEEEVEEEKKKQVPVHKPRKSAQNAPAAEPKMPEALNTPAFLATWNLWCQHRKEIKNPLKPTTMAGQLEYLAKQGVVSATFRIKRAIAGGYVGLFFNSDGERQVVYTEDFDAPTTRTNGGRRVPAAGAGGILPAQQNGGYKQPQTFNTITGERTDGPTN
jgi:hypothetical protein